MNVETQPSPDGRYFQHTLMGRAQAEPSAKFTDSVADLERLSEGDSYPMVSAWQEGTDWLISVSLWSENESPSPEEIATLKGTLAEVVASTRL